MKPRQQPQARLDSAARRQRRLAQPRIIHPDACANCQRALATTAGLCRACYEYRRRNGRTRPPEGIRLRRSDPLTACHNCGDMPTAARNLCHNCHRYHHRTGKNRPRHIYDPTAPCKNPNCKKPLASDGYPRNGYCCACYYYRRRTGHNRPRHLCDRTRQQHLS